MFRNKTDQCTCEEATGYSRQCVHETLLLDGFETSFYDNIWFFCDIVTCSRDIGNYKNPNTSQQINMDLWETFDDYEGKTESFYNLSINYDVINENKIHWNSQRIKKYHIMISCLFHQNFIIHWSGIKNTKLFYSVFYNNF